MSEQLENKEGVINKEDIEERQETTEETGTEQETQKEEQKEEKEDKTLKLKGQPFEIIDGIKYPKHLMEEARLEGWREKEFLKNVGKDSKYLAPDVFVERGRKAVPFLTKKIDNYKRENEDLKKLIEKQIRNQVLDKIDNVNNKIENASDVGDSGKIQSLTRKKIELENELKELEEKKKEYETQREVDYRDLQENNPRFTKPKEILDWELNNPWCLDVSNPENITKTKIANNLYEKINTSPETSHLSVAQKLELLDFNLNQQESITKQKRNLSSPTGSKTNNYSNPSNAPLIRSIDNLKPEYKRDYEKFCYDQSTGKKLEGNSLKLYRESFLNACDARHFKNS